MENIAIYVKETIGSRQSDIVWAKYLDSKEWLEIITQDIRKGLRVRR